MAALLILGGMVLCLLGWLWLWQRTAREHWVWALTGVLPPLALLSGLMNGRVALLPLLVFVSGLGILGGGLWQLGQTQPQQLERLLQGHWKELADSDADVLQGQVQGQAFLPDQVSLGGVFSFCARARTLLPARKCAWTCQPMARHCLMST